MPNKIVRGQITDKNGGSAAGLKVMAYHFMIRLQTETKLGEATCGPQGGYSIKYPDDTVPGARVVNLLIKVFDPGDGNRQLGVSEVVENAGAEEVINLELTLPKEEPADTGRKAVSYPVRLASKGEKVSVLHAALKFLNLAVGRTERTAQKFGAETRKAVLKFQKDNRVKQTGIVDEATAKAMNDLLESKGYFAKTAAPFRARFLRAKSGEISKIDDADTRKHVSATLKARLADALIAQFKEPGDKLRQAIGALDLDAEALQEKDLVEVIREEVLPRLIDNDELRDEVEALDDDAFPDSAGTVRETLNLDLPFRANPLFAREVRRARNLELAANSRLPDAKKEKVADLDLDLLDRGQWAKLVEDKTLNEQEAEALLLQVEFAKLSDDNLELIKALQEGEPAVGAKPVKDTRDLVQWDRRKWKDLLQKRNIAPPDDDDLDAFAANLDYNIQLTFPTRYFLHRAVEQPAPDRRPDITRILPVLGKNERIFDRNDFDSLDLDAFSEGEREALKTPYANLRELSNRYKRLGLAAVLSPSREPASGEPRFETAAAKQKEITRRLGLLKTFYAKNPDIDLHASHFYANADDDVPENLRVSLDGIADAGDQEMVLGQMRAFQRALHLGGDFDTGDKLLRRGFDSAMEITALPERRFVETMQGELDENEALRVYERAEKTAIKTNHLLAMMQENHTNAKRLGGLGRFFPSDDKYQEDPAARESGARAGRDPRIRKMFRDIPGYDELFGSQNYCSCPDCRSVFSPAAYFVHLMDFVKTQVTERYFKGRTLQRHDLNLKVRRPDLWSLPLTCDNTNKMIPYLDIVLEVLETHIRIKDPDINSTNGVYEALATSQASFRQPFNLPLERLRLCLRHFGVELLDIYQLLGAGSVAVAAERLGLSREEFGEISPQNFGGLTQTNVEVAQNRFPALYQGPVRLVRNFMKDTGLNRKEVDTLLQTNTISGIARLTIAPTSNGEQGTEAIFESLGQGLEEKMTNLPDIRGAGNAVYQWIYFFVRIWRAVPWSMAELDAVIGMLTPIDRSTGRRLPLHDFQPRNFRKLLLNMAHFLGLQQKLGVSAEQMIAIAGEIPTRGEDNMFQRLFSKHFTPTAQQPITLEELNERHYTFEPGVFAYLQGALGIRDIDLQRLNGLFKPAGTLTLNLGLAELSHYYRYATIAKALDLSIDALIFVETHVLGAPKGLALTDRDDLPEYIARLVGEFEKLDDLPFSLEELELLITGEPAGNAGYAFGYEQLRSLVEGLPADTAIYFTAEKLAETGEIPPAHSTRIIYKMAELGLLGRLKIYRFDDRFAGADDATLNAIQQAFDNPATHNVTEINPLILANRNAIRTLLSHNRQQVIPERLTLEHNMSEANVMALVTALEQQKVLIPVTDLFRLNHRWTPGSDQVFTELIAAFATDSATHETAAINANEPNIYKLLHETVVNKSRVIRELLEPYHTPLPAPAAALLGVSQTRFDVLADVLGLPQNDTFVRDLETLLARSGSALLPASDTVQNILTAIRRVERAQRLFEAFKFDETAMRFISANRAVFAFHTRPVFNWETVCLLNTYRGLLEGKDAEERQSVDKLIRSWETEPSKVELARVLNTNPAQFVQARLTGKLLDRVVPFQRKVLALRQQLSIDGRALEKLNAVAYNDLAVAANIALHLIHARYDEAEREKVLEPIEDKLRSCRRDALIDFVLTRNSRYRFQNEHDLLHYFLIDVKMEGCARISRIVAATLSLQLYVHYVRMGLEVGPEGIFAVPSDAITDDEWLWRKNYRVWEAAMKVFVYPENYLEPDLRPNKTTLFKEFESLIYQEDSSQREVVENGYKSYLKSLNEISRLRILDCYFHDNTYYLFGRTGVVPYEYYWQTYNPGNGFSEWSRVELEINSSRVSPIIFQDRLYVFWLEATPQNITKENDSDILIYSHLLVVKYSYRNESGQWSRIIEMKPPLLEVKSAKIISDTDRYILDSEMLQHTEKSFLEGLDKSHTYKKLILYNENIDQLSLNYYHSTQQIKQEQIAGITHRNFIYQFNHIIPSRVDFFNNSIFHNPQINDVKSSINTIRILDSRIGTFIFMEDDEPYRPKVIGIPYFLTTADINFHFYNLDWWNKERFVPIANLNKPQGSDIFFIHNKMSSSILQYDKVFYLVTNANNTHALTRLSTSISEVLGKKLFNQGIESFHQKENQELSEKKVEITPIPQASGRTLLIPEPHNHPDFHGAYGVYYQELFFHMPCLQASYLNSLQKFENAQYWYKKIFNPNSDINSDEGLWKYIEFQNREVKSFGDIFSNEVAFYNYTNDPFNPHAVARLRLSAYMKNIVMKYIDNLLDWGDKLFAQDSFESINEALMLYVQAYDILGEKPYETGKCGVIDEESLNYELIENEGETSGILTSIEHTVQMQLTIPEQVVFIPPAPAGNTFITNTLPRKQVTQYVFARANKKNKTAPVNLSRKRVPALDIHGPATLSTRPRTPVKEWAFCVPPNETLLKYWDRVEDRLFKIRNCMNIDGVRRQLPLFQPPIDPMLLVRARAAGLSLEDILDMLAAKPPAYRFAYLLEKAKEFARTVQSYGSNLLSALEKKDAEELTLLRSVHEQDLLAMVERVKKETIEEAKENITVTEKSKSTAEARLKFYEDLLEKVVDESLGYDKMEEDNLKQQEKAKSKQKKASNFDYYASIIHAAPTGNFTIGWHWPITKDNPNPRYTDLSFSYGTANVAAALTAKANKERRASTMSSLEAGLTSTKSGYHRRKQEWQNQKTLAAKEIEQIERQIVAAEIRLSIAEKDLDSHKKQMEQSRELYDFYKGKFTNMGLYTWLSTQLTRLYRQAYNMALDMARQAERAYQFERDDQAYFIKNDNWDTNRAGLLAGERLLLQLQQMEKSYLEKNTRDYEINQSFSLLQLAPGQLIQLKEDGNCAFTLPEAAYDLTYPGYYKRIIKSVRLTIPCVTGPYTNVSCKLSLMGSSIRRNPTTNDNDLFAAPNTLTNSIATSTANNDGGVFELNFRDERYLPFEGAGAAESRWALLMPEQFRAFDYNTISDVIIHVSYTAKFDGGLKQAVETALLTEVNTMVADNNRQNEPGLFRLFSLKHEFGDACHELLNGAPSVTIQIDDRHFPMLFMGRQKQLAGTVVHILPKQGRTLSPPPALTVTPPTGNITGPWSIRFNAGINAGQADAIDNIFIELRYTL